MIRTILPLVIALFPLSEAVLAFVGLGLFFANWLSMLGLLVPITLAVWNRVAKEERALLSFFGDDYAAYCVHTRRFVPGLF